MKRINDNAYILNLHGQYGVTAIFNASYLSPFGADDDLRTNPFREGENDGHNGATQVSSHVRDHLEPFKWSYHNIYGQAIQGSTERPYSTSLRHLE